LGCLHQRAKKDHRDREQWRLKTTSLRMRRLHRRNLICRLITTIRNHLIEEMPSENKEGPEGRALRCSKSNASAKKRAKNPLEIGLGFPRPGGSEKKLVGGLWGGLKWTNYPSLQEKIRVFCTYRGMRKESKKIYED